jgi:hypothetical protein
MLQHGAPQDLASKYLCVNSMKLDVMSWDCRRLDIVTSKTLTIPIITLWVPLQPAMGKMEYNYGSPRHSRYMKTGLPFAPEMSKSLLQMPPISL